MKQAANENTEQALARAQRELNKGAEELRAAPQEDLKEAAKRAAEQSAKAQEAVANEARRQQELGSEEVARQLELLAGAFDQAKLLPDLKELVDGKTAEVSMPLEKMENLAGLLAGAQLRLREGKEGLAQTIAELDRAAANIPRLAEAGTGNDPDKESLAAEIQSDIQAAAQKAAAGGGSEAKEGAADVLSALTAGAFGSSRTLGGSGASEAGKKRAYTDLESTVKKLADLLRDDLENARRRETLLEFKPDDAPPEYREAVSVYFEELSRPSKPEGTPKSEP
jgi:hypothetical protein